MKRSVHARKKRRKVLDQAKGYYGRKSTHYRYAKEQVEHSLVYAYRDRRNKKRNFRSLWIVRINAAARANGLRTTSSSTASTRRGSSSTASRSPISPSSTRRVHGGGGAGKGRSRLDRRRRRGRLRSSPRSLVEPRDRFAARRGTRRPRRPSTPGWPSVSRSTFAGRADPRRRRRAMMRRSGCSQQSIRSCSRGPRPTP